MDTTGTLNGALARAFSPGMLSALADKDQSAANARINALLQSTGALRGQDAWTLARTFDEAHSQLADRYRSEYFYKNAIVSKVIFGRHSPNTASALLELPAGRSIADVVVLNGTSTAYEIKTDLDSFSRLAVQLADYARCFERVNVVTSVARMAAAIAQTPKSVGVIGLKRNGGLTVGREASSGLSELDPWAMFELLRTREALALLEAELGYELDVPPGDIWPRCRDLFCNLPIDAAHEGLVRQLRLRGFNGGALARQPHFPPSLRALAYSKELSEAGRKRATNRLAQFVAQTGGIDTSPV